MAISAPPNTFVNASNQTPSVQAAGVTSATPTAGTTIATLAAVTNTGMYTVTCYTVVTAAVAAADANNIGLYVNGNLRATVPVPAVVNIANPVAVFTLQLASGDVITAKVIANASTGAIYNATVVAQQVS